MRNYFPLSNCLIMSKLNDHGADKGSTEDISAVTDEANDFLYHPITQEEIELHLSS